MIILAILGTMSWFGILTRLTQDPRAGRGARHREPGMASFLPRLVPPRGRHLARTVQAFELVA